jgi:hypothetical protein
MAQLTAKSLATRPPPQPPPVARDSQIVAIGEESGGSADSRARSRKKGIRPACFPAAMNFFCNRFLSVACPPRPPGDTSARNCIESKKKPRARHLDRHVDRHVDRHGDQLQCPGRVRGNERNPPREPSRRSSLSSLHLTPSYAVFRVVVSKHVLQVMHSWEFRLRKDDRGD